MRIAVVLTARPSWSKLGPVCAQLVLQQQDVIVLACASALLERYGAVVKDVRAQGFTVEEVWSSLEGSTQLTAALETGSLIQALAPALTRLSPDVVVVCADRHEVLGAAFAAAMLHLPLIHLQGGEVTCGGTIDDRIRPAVSALAQVHLPCTHEAAKRVRAISAGRIVTVGCPSVDTALKAKCDPPVTLAELGGDGPPVDLARPFLAALLHPVTKHPDQAAGSMQRLLEAIADVPLPAVLWWPGHDAGGDAMAKVIRQWRADHPSQTLHTVRHTPARRFLKLLTQASVLVGNSSTGIRECSALGVPVVNVGFRQRGRERAANVFDAPDQSAAIARAIQRQITHGPYPPSTLYGDGTAAIQSAQVIQET